MDEPTGDGMISESDVANGKPKGRPLAEAGAKQTESDHRGRIYKLEGRTLRGWYLDPFEPSRKPEIEVLVDGVVTGTTRADRPRRIDNKHGFRITLSAGLFDGGRHTIQARRLGETSFFKNTLVDIEMPFLNIDQCSFQIASVQKGEIVGYLVNNETPSDTLSVELLDGDVVLAVQEANLDLPELGAIAAHGFIFKIADLVPGDPLQTELSIRIAGTNHFIPHDFGNLARHACSLVIDEVSDAEVIGHLNVYGKADPSHQLDLRLNNEIIDIVWPDKKRRNIYPISSIFREAALRSRNLELSITDPRKGDAIVGAPQDLVLPVAEGVVRNDDFSSWQDARLQGWEVPESLRSRVLPTATPSGPGAIFDLSGLETTDSTLIASQNVSLESLPQWDRRLDLVLSHGASHDSKIDVVLTVRDKGQGVYSVKAPTTASPVWTTRVHRLLLPLPPAELEPGAELAIHFSRGDAAAYRVARLALGAPGFISSQGQTGVPTADPARPFNAVTNSEFANWSGPLAREVEARRFSCGDGWEFFAKAQKNTLIVKLDTVAVRDPTIGLASRPTYGLSIKGQIVSGYARLETVLMLDDLRSARASELGFYALSGAGAKIGRIFVLDRHAGDPGASPETVLHERIVVEVAKNVPVRRNGGVHRLAMSPLIAEALTRAARDAFADPLRDLILVFEFSGDVEITLSAVTLGRSMVPARDNHDTYVRLEDDTIFDQLDQFKMLEVWGSGTRIVAAESRVAPSSPVEWRRPTPQFPSVDIVICVYNAYDDVKLCLQSILENTHVPITVTIVDDASDLPTKSLIAQFSAEKPWVRVIDRGENLGYTRSANLGLSNCDAEWVVLLNSDTIVTPGWIEGLIRCAQSDPEIAFVGPLSNAASWQSVPDVVAPGGGWKVNLLPPGMSAPEMAALVASCSRREYPEVPLLNGFCTLMRTSVLQSIGFLDEASFPTGYGEENDLCIRASAAGYKLVIADDVYIYHSKSASFGNERRKELSRAGTAAFRRKHPDLNLETLKLHLSESAPIVGLRARLREALGSIEFGPDGLAVETPVAEQHV